MPIVWVEESVVHALHEEHLAEHGGTVGIRDGGLLESALFRPRHLVNYGEPDLVALAVAYGYGFARNYPFIDGNKRTALTITELFLALNGQALMADDQSCFVTMIKLAEGICPKQSLLTGSGRIRNRWKSGESCFNWVQRHLRHDWQ